MSATVPERDMPRPRGRSLAPAEFAAAVALRPDDPEIRLARARALGEARRVLRDGGHVGVMVWGPGEECDGEGHRLGAYSARLWLPLLRSERKP